MADKQKKKDREYLSFEELWKQAQTGVNVPFGKLDTTGRIFTAEKNKGIVGNVVQEALFEIASNSRPEPDVANLNIELKTTPFKRNKNGTVSAKERLVCNMLDYCSEELDDFYNSSFWKKCQKILFSFYDGTKDKRKVWEYYIVKNYFFTWIKEDMPTILEDYKRITTKIKDGKADTLSESDGNYISTCTKGTTTKYRKQPFSSVLAKDRAWDIKSSYMTYLLRNYVFNQTELESIAKGNQNLSFEQIITKELALYFGKTKQELYAQFNINPKEKSANNTLIRKMLKLSGNIDNTSEFTKANMNLRVIQITHTGMPKEDNPFKCYKFKEIIKTPWEESCVKEEICDKKFMFVFFKSDDKNNKIYKLEKVIFWGYPENLILEAKRVWQETIDIINNGVKLEIENWGKEKRVKSNFPTSADNKIIFTKIHASETYYEIEPNKFIGKGALADTDELPDGRRITKHSFWFSKKFIKKIYNKEV